MLKKLLTFLALLFLFAEAGAQSLPRLPITWSKRFSPDSTFIYITSSDTFFDDYSRYTHFQDDGTIVYTDSRYQHRAAFILNDTGAVVRSSERLKGGTASASDYVAPGYLSRSPINGGFVACGMGNASLTDSSFAGAGFHTGSTSNALIYKYNDSMEIEWIKYYGGTGATGWFGNGFGQVIETQDGGYIAAGLTVSQDGDLLGVKRFTNAPVYWIVKTDSIGTIQWQKTYGGPRFTPTNFLHAYGAGRVIENRADSTYLVLGVTASQAGDVWGAHGHNDIWVLKLNSVGDTLWTRAYGGSGNDQAFSVFQTKDGNCIITGSTGSTDGDLLTVSGNGGAWRFKINSTNGNIIWQRREGDVVAPGATTYAEHHPSMVELQDGTLVWAYSGNDTTSMPNSNVQIRHIDGNTGTTLRIGSYGSSMAEIPVRLRLNEDNSILVMNVFGVPSGIYADYDLTGHDTVGTNWWFTLAPCPALATAPDVTICAGDSYTFGSQVITTAGTYYDTLSTSYSCDSIVTLVVHIDTLPTPTITASGNTLSTGAYTSYQWLNGSNSPISGATAQTYEATTAGNYRVVVTNANGCSDTSDVYNHTPSSIDEPALFSSMKLYPNPASDMVNIEIPQLKGNATIELSNVEGRVIIENDELRMANYELSIADLPSGVYFIKITAEEGIAVRKLIKK